MENLKNVKLIITDNKNNFYGILGVKSPYTEYGISCILKDIIRDNFSKYVDNEKLEFPFFEDFSGNLSIAIEKLSDYLLEKCKDSEITFDYYNCDYFNVDTIF